MAATGGKTEQVRRQVGRHSGRQVLHRSSIPCGLGPSTAAPALSASDPALNRTRPGKRLALPQHRGNRRQASKAAKTLADTRTRSAVEVAAPHGACPSRSSSKHRILPYTNTPQEPPCPSHRPAAHVGSIGGGRGGPADYAPDPRPAVCGQLPGPVRPLPRLVLQLAPVAGGARPGGLPPPRPHWAGGARLVHAGWVVPGGWWCRVQCRVHPACEGQERGMLALCCGSKACGTGPPPSAPSAE